jgi:hypothetical protein
MAKMHSFAVTTPIWSLGNRHRNLWQGGLSRPALSLADRCLLSLLGFSGVFRPAHISQRLTREALQPLAGPVGGARQADHIAFLKRER